MPEPRPLPSRRQPADYLPLDERREHPLLAGLIVVIRRARRVATLIAMNRPDQLRSHLARARDNGSTEQDLIEAITHLAFCAGWPSAVTAVGAAREVFEEK